MYRDERRLRDCVCLCIGGMMLNKAELAGEGSRLWMFKEEARPASSACDQFSVNHNVG